MTTLICKFYRARVDGENVVLEIDEAQPTSFVPQLMTKADVASRLKISSGKIEGLVRSGRLAIIRIDGSVRFKEEDVLRLLTENQGPKPRVLVSPISPKLQV
jgi:excisionase family DNA binding protein